MAKELVRQSGTRGSAVTIQGEASDHALNAYLATVLRQLGYTVRLREVPGSISYDGFKALGQAQVTSGPFWIADYPAASNFYDGYFSCTTSRGAGGYCNPQVERTAAQAHEAEMSDPAKGRRLWAEVDRMITDDAPVVALGNGASTTLVSARVGNYQSTPVVGPVLSQMWVR